jgi:hypothetical protein
MLSVSLLPAAHGDAIWIEYGSVRTKRLVLVDGGPAHTYGTGLQTRLDALKRLSSKQVELLVVTHIDADHIDGALILLQDRHRLGLKIGEVWFNTWTHLPTSPERDRFAPLQGEFLGALIKQDEQLAAALNRSFGHKAVQVPLDSLKLPAVPLAGGAVLTLLGPTPTDLKRLRARWSAAIRDFAAGDEAEALRRLQERREYRPPSGPAVFSSRTFGDDRSPANGSSISFLFEFGGNSVLFAGDSHARTLSTNLKRLCRERGVPRLAIDAVKLPHHGSLSNVTSEWISMVDTKRWLISTNGAVFGHPDLETAELIRDCNRGSVPSFYCNYDSPTTQRLQPGHDRGDWRLFLPRKVAGQPTEGMTLNLEETSAPPRQTAARRGGKHGR